jgi:periplasmic divalent cation tolerance protein
MHSLIIISTTFEQKEDGARVARLLLDERLVACAQLSGPISSYYRWKGNVASSTEFSLSLKTIGPLYKNVEARLKEVHPYELPEIVSQTITGVSEEYMEWVKTEVLQ